jgi:hypothetical protein
MKALKKIGSILLGILMIALILGVSLGWDALKSLINSKISKSGNCIGGKDEAIDGTAC